MGTIILMVLVTLMLASLLGADFFARMVSVRIYHHLLAAAAAFIVRGVGWVHEVPTSAAMDTTTMSPPSVVVTCGVLWVVTLESLWPTTLSTTPAMCRT